MCGQLLRRHNERLILTSKSQDDEEVLVVRDNGPGVLGESDDDELVDRDNGLLLGLADAGQG